MLRPTVPVRQTSTMRVISDLRSEFDLTAIVRHEINTRNKLLPPRWSDRALIGQEDKVATWMKSLMRRDIPVEPEEILLARKLGRGARPVAVLGLKERLLYRAAVSLVEQEVGPPDRSSETYDQFQRAPLSTDGCEYVVKADVASYYQFIDHERLIDEVVAQTGDDLPVAMAVDLVRETSGRRFGLPQLSASSDVLAEIYIEPVRRELARGGLAAWRFADDFRIACRNYDEALRALEILDDAARELGLVLNEVKTSTPSRSHYEAGIDATRNRERELFEALQLEELEEPDRGWYDEADADDEVAELPTQLLDEPDFEDGELGLDELPPGSHEISEAQIAAATAVLEAWTYEDEDDETQRSEHARVTARLLGRALRVFGHAGSPLAIGQVASMLVYEPSLTPTIMRYVQALGRVERNLAQEALDDVCGSGIVSAWQSVWVAHVAGDLAPRRGGANRPHVQWLRAQLTSQRDSLRAEAALALARRRLASIEELLDVLQGLPESHRPTVLIAIAIIGGRDRALDLAESELDRLRVAGMTDGN